MPTFEQGFASAENAADSALQAVSDFTKLARELRKAARDGNIAAVRKSAERLQDSTALVRQEAVNAANAWPFTPEEEQEHLRERYAEELKGEALKKGLRMDDQDGRLIAHPSVVRVIPAERALRINQQKMSRIRPTRVVDALEKLQRSPPRFRSAAFLESLYRAYLILTGRTSSEQLKLREVGQVVQLVRIYDLFTGLPGASRDYDKLDFARDLDTLESSGTRETRSGARVSFPASTGTKATTGTISFVKHTGENVVYYGIQFGQGGQR